MKLRNIGKNPLIVDRVKGPDGKFVHQVLGVGQTADIEAKKAEKLLRNYPYGVVKDDMLVQKPSEFEAAKKAAAEKDAADKKAAAEAAKAAESAKKADKGADDKKAAEA